MNSGRLVFSQAMDFLPKYEYNKCVNRYGGNYRVHTLSCYDQFLCMAFAQLTYRESLRGAVTCLQALAPKLFHAGIRGNITRSTLADANEKRDWRIYADFAQVLIVQARRLYANEDFGIELENTAYALDASTIDLCLSMFPWANFRKAKGAVKLHTLLDLRGNIPVFIHISDGKLHDVNVLDILIPEPGSIYLMDRGYVDFKRLYALHCASAFLVTRAKSNLKYQRKGSRHVNKTTGLLFDQDVVLKGFYSRQDYPITIRRIVYRDLDTAQKYCYLTNNFVLPALTIAHLYKARWQVELFFKWIKQHLRIKTFLWHFGECRQNSNLDSGLQLCTYCHHEEASWNRAKPLHNSADFKRQSFREKPHFTGVFER